MRIVEKGGDFGGTWYWNRYPGAQCDTASMVYMPLLEETGHMPTEKYAHAPEILAQCQRIGKQYGLYDNALFHTEVEDLSWDEANARWVIKTNRGDAFTAQLHRPGHRPAARGRSCPAFPASRLQGPLVPHQPLGLRLYRRRPERRADDKLADKRVAIIGTGATSVQAVPHLAGACKQLYVVQRTPSSVDVRDNKPIDPEWFAEHRDARLAAALAGKLHRQPGRRHGRGRSGPGRLDRPVAPHPRRKISSCRARS